MAAEPRCDTLQLTQLPSSRRRPLSRRRRSGATTLETAIALSLFVTLILGTVDLGYGLFRHHVLSHAARQLARKAIVHGALADRKGSWGPEAISMKASDGGPITSAVESTLVGWDLDEVEIEVHWIDGGNDVRYGNRIHVAMSASYRPIMTFILGNHQFNLTATSTMAVAH